LGLPIAVAFASQAQARAAASALDGIARQPEMAGKLQVAMIIALALIESLVIYVLVTFFILSAKLDKVMDVVKATPEAAVTSTQ
jgi:F-type H+-transporting ATPase subunit c